MLFLSFNKLSNYVSKACVFQNIHTIFLMFHQGALLASLQVLFLFILSFLASNTCVSLNFFHFRIQIFFSLETNGKNPLQKQTNTT
jgi:hypothetical protein